MSERRVRRVADRLSEAYLLLARKGRYRPAAPSDGFGNIIMGEADLQNPAFLEDEALRYGRQLARCDDKMKWTISGCLHWPHIRLFVYLFEAANLCFAGVYARPIIKRLLQLAADELRDIDAAS